MTDIIDRLNDSLSAAYSELREEAAQEILQLRKERDELRHRLALESQENGALRDSVDRACEERDELRTELKEVRHGVAVAHDVINTLRAEVESWKGLAQQFGNEADAMRTKIAEMEKQEPVGVLHVGSYYGEELQDWEFEANQLACDKLNEAYVSKPTSLPLYALPAPSRDR